MATISTFPIPHPPLIFALLTESLIHEHVSSTQDEQLTLVLQSVIHFLMVLVELTVPQVPREEEGRGGVILWGKDNRGR